MGEFEMVTSVKKWGNSLGIRLPKSIAEDIVINDGSKLNIIVKNGKIELTKVESELNLDDLIAGITEQNLHNEIDSGVSIGNEL
jgi:antitoxin MazE